MTCRTPATSRVCTIALVALAVFGALLPAASAQVQTTYTGDTSGGNMWSRPDVYSGGISSGTQLYTQQQISTPQSDTYTITANWTSWDGYLCLYEGTFDPNDQLTNLIAQNDDGSSLYDSEIFAQQLFAGTTYIVVHTAYGSDSGPFTVTIDGPVQVNLGGAPAGPTVTAINPNTGSTAGGESVTITGSGFTGGAAGVTAVTIGGAGASTINVQNDTTLTCVTPPGSAGTASVEVTTSLGTSASNSLFTYQAPSGPAPTVTSVNPQSGPEAGGTAVTISGTELSGATSVMFGTAAATNVVPVSNTRITCTSPPGTGSVQVVVTTPNGTSSQSVQFTYYSAIPPTVTGVSPASGPAIGGTPVTITGSNFANAVGVYFGGELAGNMTVVNANQITCTTPWGMGTVPVVVQTLGGTSAQGVNFAYIGQVFIRPVEEGGCAFAPGASWVRLLPFALVLAGLLGLRRRRSARHTRTL